MPTLLTCLDDSVYTSSVLEHAAWAADRLGASMELLHTLERHPERAATANLSGAIGLGSHEALLAELAELDERRGKLTMEHARTLLASAAERTRQHGVGEVHGRVRHGDLIDALVELESDYDMLVIGKRGESADFARMHLGSHLERAMRALHLPILVAARAFRPIARVLLAFDGSPSARKAVELAAGSPLLAGLECHLVMAGSGASGETSHMAWATELLDARGVQVRAEVIPGHADDVIAQYVRQCGIDLLVMGAYGHSRIRQLIVGSTTTSLIRACLVPVLLVR